MDESIKIMNLRDTPELIPEAAAWFAAKWGIPREEYEASMRESAESRAPVPQWFAVTDARGKITAGAGIIQNDFHDRKDLSPNLCALFVEERYRRRGIAGELLDFAREAMRRAGIPKLYLVTEHTSFYERCGWRHTSDAASDDGVKMRVYEAEC